MKKPQKAAAAVLVFMGLVAAGLPAQQLPLTVQNALKNLSIIPFVDPVQSANFELPSWNGGNLSLLGDGDKLVMLNFWATWCGPCRSEMPSMQSLYDDFAGKGLEILAVNQLEARDLVADFMQEFRYTYPALLDQNGRISYQYGVRSIPTTYLIAPNGRIIGGKVGAHDWNTPEARIAWQTLIDYYIN